MHTQVKKKKKDFFPLSNIPIGNVRAFKNPQTMISRKGSSEPVNLPLQILKRIAQTVLLIGTQNLLNSHQKLKHLKFDFYSLYSKSTSYGI